MDAVNRYEPLTACSRSSYIAVAEPAARGAARPAFVVDPPCRLRGADTRLRTLVRQTAATAFEPSLRRHYRRSPPPDASLAGCADSLTAWPAALSTGHTSITITNRKGDHGQP